MPGRRTFLSLLAGSAVAPHLALAQRRSQRLALYANVGPVFMHYDVDPAEAELIKRGAVILPAAVQYCWPHRERRHFYVASSNSTPGNAQTGTEHYVTAFAIDATTGALSQIGDSMRLPVRPIHMTLDNESQHILVAFNNPSSLRVYRVNKDFTAGEEVPQGAMDAGIYAHQVRVTPDGRHVVLVTRGNEGTPQRPEDPGALMVFDYQNGVLSNQDKIAPNGGRGYGPRHLDFIRRSRGCSCRSKRRISCTCTTCRVASRYRQLFSTRRHYWSPATSVRAKRQARCTFIRMGVSSTPQSARRMWSISRGRKSTGGENSIVVYSINQQTSEPSAIQHIETTKFHPRTFHVAPSGHMLVAQHNLPLDVRDGDNARTVSAGLSVFRMGAEGKLTLARTYDIDVGDQSMWWMGMVSL